MTGCIPLLSKYTAEQMVGAFEHLEWNNAEVSL